jgi:hypothetical protein
VQRHADLDPRFPIVGASKRQLGQSLPGELNIVAPAISISRRRLFMIAHRVLIPLRGLSFATRAVQGIPFSD